MVEGSVVIMATENRTRFEVVQELAIAEKQHKYCWSMRSHETEKGKQRRLKLNRKRKQLKQELSTFQHRMEGF